MRKNGYPRFTVRKIENAFVVDITDEDYNIEEYAYQTIDNVIDKLQEVLKSNGK